MEGAIKEFIKKAIEEIQAGLPEGYEITDEVAFDISVITTTSKKGGINIQLASGEIDKEKQTVHNINFGVVNLKKQEEAMQSNASAVISIVKQGIGALSSIAESQNENKEVKKLETS